MPVIFVVGWIKGGVLTYTKIWSIPLDNFYRWFSTKLRAEQVWERAKCDFKFEIYQRAANPRGQIKIYGPFKVYHHALEYKVHREQDAIEWYAVPIALHHGLYVDTHNCLFQEN